MKTLLLAVLLVAAAVTAPAAEESKTAASPSIAKDSRCFELRTYYAAPGKLEALNARFRDHTCRLFKKHGMEIVGFNKTPAEFAREQLADCRLAGA